MTEPVDLAAGEGAGPLWGTATSDLNVTLLAWPAGHVVAGHINHERDVLIVVVAGSATVHVEGVAHALEAPAALVLPKGSRRSIAAGASGVRYVSSHLRRSGLQIRRPD